MVILFKLLERTNHVLKTDKKVHFEIVQNWLATNALSYGEVCKNQLACKNLKKFEWKKKNLNVNFLQQL